MKSFISGLFLSLGLAAGLRLAAAEPVNVPFAIGMQEFREGDAIFIQQVLATSPNATVGDRITVRGQYQLRSRTIAVVAVNLTPAKEGGRKEGVTRAQKKEIKEGSGSFELSYDIKQAGQLHVRFYSRSEGRPFGGLEFVAGTAAADRTGATSAAPDSSRSSPAGSDDQRQFLRPVDDPPPADAETSLLQLLANPGHHHGKKVLVAGYATVDSRGQWLFPSPQFAISLTNGLWLDRDFGHLSAGSQLMKFAPVRVEAIFDAHPEGPAAQGSGVLREITRFEPLPAP